MVTVSDIVKIANEFKLNSKVIQAFIKVESSGSGFNNGKLLIQFEPTWFRRLSKNAKEGSWSKNSVGNQAEEWSAFNSAFQLDKNAAMQSTSIGLGQVMGFHYKDLGYTSVGDMWNDAKKGEDRQLWQMIKFISLNKNLVNAVNTKNFDRIAYYYNGPMYKKYDYSNRLKKAYESI